MGDPLGQPEFLLEQPRAREGTGLITVEYSILGDTWQYWATLRIRAILIALE